MTFEKLFIGGHQAHGRYQVEPKFVETVRKPAPPAAYREHLAGGVGLGLVPIRTDGTCRFAAIDIDVDTIDHKKLRAEVVKRRMPLAVCRSKSGGAHLYLFAKEPGIAAAKVIPLLKKWALRLGHPGVEVFPKQTKITKEDCGNWINLPYHAGDRTTRYAVGDRGSLTLAEFLASIEFYDITHCDADESSPPAKPQAVAPAAPEKQVADCGFITEGGRNSTLTSVAGAMRRSGMDREGITAGLLIHNRAHCQPPLSDREVTGIAASVSRYEPPPEQPNFTDSGNSDRLVARYGENLRFDHNRRAWFVWDGRRFRPDTRNRVKVMARGVARDLFVAAALETNDAERKRILRWAIQTENRNRRENLVAVTEPVEGIASLTPDFDRDPWVLNFHNGVLDLEKEKLRKQIQHGRPAEPRREDMISKLCAGPYEPQASCPQFMAFLERIFDGDQEMLSYIARMAGYFLTGVTWERCFFLGYGPQGANGKTTLSEVFRLMLGDYGQTAAVQTFLKGRSDKVRDDLAKLPGARVVCTPEPAANQQLDEATIKLWTGGEDEIQARPLYGRLFEFKPTGKLFMICNHKPTIRGTDNAIWSRVHLIPFNISIPPEQRDKKLLQKLKGEFAGILAWAVRGCLDWQERESLDPPPIVLSATDNYRNEMDRVKVFLAECCTRTPTSRVEPRRLHTVYRDWCGQDWSLGYAAFGLRLKEQGFNQQKGAQGVRYWKGLGLLVHEEQGRLPDGENSDVPF